MAEGQVLQLVLTVVCEGSNGFSPPASEAFFTGIVNLPCFWAFLCQISLKGGGNNFKSIVTLFQEEFSIGVMELFILRRKKKPKTTNKN